MRSLDVQKYLALQEYAARDEEYLLLVEEYRQVNGRMLRALEEMAPAHREIVLDYLGVVHAAHGRMLELSILIGEKS